MDDSTQKCSSLKPQFRPQIHYWDILKGLKVMEINIHIFLIKWRYASVWKATEVCELEELFLANSRKCFGRDSSLSIQQLPTKSVHRWKFCEISWDFVTKVHFWIFFWSDNLNFCRRAITKKSNGICSICNPPLIGSNVFVMSQCPWRQATGSGHSRNRHFLRCKHKKSEKLPF